MKETPGTESSKAKRNCTKKRSAQKKSRRLSHVLRPSDMGLIEWQKALRKQAAEQEKLLVTKNLQTDEPGSFVVVNPATDNEYKVIYRGAHCMWNYCSCMDFKASRLGTCKHIEAVRIWHKKHRKPLDKTLPSYTAVYLLYQESRRVCIRIGTDDQEAFTSLASEYFTTDGYLKPEAIDDFSTFLSRASNINNTFRCYPDALQYILDLRDEKRRAALVDNQCSDAYLDTLLYTQLYPYQMEGIRFAIKTGKSIIADEMGLGKTVQAIGSAEFLRKEKFISSVLIVCPTSLKYQWKREIERFTRCNALIIEGTHLKRKQQYEEDTFYKIVSYNSLCNDIKILRHMHVDFLVMDEAQRLKNWNTQIAQAMRRIHSDYMTVLSGTPLENKLQELYAIVQLVNPYVLGPLYEFVDSTTVFAPSGQVIGYNHLNEIGEKLKRVMIRRRKADVQLQLPPRIDNIRFVPMTSDQMGMHDEFKSHVAKLINKWHHTHFLSENDRKRLLLLLSQMRMVCDSTFILDQHSRYDTKIDELMHMVENMIENGNDKMVVFSQWERMTRLVCQELDKRQIGYANLNGSVPSAKRKELMDRFTTASDCRVFISTDAGSTGLNLQVASILVNLDLPWNPAVLEQRIARIYRIGQSKTVYIFNMVSEHTIEERMLTTLNFKSNMSEGILDNGTDAVFLENSKFKRLMDTIEEVVDDNEQATETIDNMVEDPVDENFEAEIDNQAHPNPTDATERKDATETQLTDTQDTSTELPGPSHHTRTETTTSPEELIHQGVSFLKGLTQTLASPDKTKALVDTIVKQDKETGQTHIEIPVPDKDTVTNLLSLFSKILSSAK